MKKRGIIMAILTAGALMLSGCGSAPKTAEAPKADNTKPVILAVSFGTSYNDTRDKTIGAVEKAIADANPDYEVRRAFTSQIIIDKLKDRDGIEIDNVKDSLDKLVKDGVKTLVVQPTHVMHGFEYDDVVAMVKKYSDKFDKLAIGEPLLSSDADFKAAADAIVADTKDYDGDDTCVVLMGHGTEHKANAAYSKLQSTFTANGPDNYFVGTVEAEPTVDDMVKMAKDGKYSRVVLRPLMVVAGDHANNDMAGDEDDSWKNIFKKEGFDVECVLKGIGEIPAIQQLYVSHVKDAIATLK